MSSLVKLGPPIAALLVAAGFQHFADELPNGHRVPNPYPQGGVWGGVGHFKVGGGGALNPFGEDFRDANFQWTKSLCRMDSDGDGRINGVELGDPNCTWVKGSGKDPALPALSHPGIVDEPRKEAVQSSCADYQEPDDAIHYDIKFSQPASINASRTHYVCQQVSMPVPKATKLHKIKSSVLLDNADILHHMFVYVCWGGFSSQDGNRVGEAPYDCDGAESTCTQIGNWAIGPHDECLPSNIGDEFDFTGLDNVVFKIEAHYDNTVGTPQQDESGIQLTFTDDLRPLTAGLTAWGMDVINKDFVIPPQQERYALTSICPSEATMAQLDEPIYVFQFYPHMHLHGRNMFTEHYRCGKKVGEMARIEPYEFDNQQQFGFAPIKILPGDALVTTCEYNTMDLDTNLTSGLGTNDEMCISIMSFYPRLPKEGQLRACFSFENGVALDRVNLAGGGAPPPPVGAGPPPDPTAMAAIINGRWALTSSNPAEGILTNFSSDPTQSWAPCCETDTCDTAFLAAKGAACAVDSDCDGGLPCDGGLCGGAVELASTTNETKPEDDASEEASGAVESVGLKFLPAALGLVSVALI